MWVIRNEAIPSWLGHAPIYHTGWRTRPDNLWAMGPLDNLVGMQYRIDHLENLKADAMDLAVLPPLVIAGEVEEFSYKPGEEIHIDENGSVTELGRNAQWVIQSDNAIAILEQRMEMYAGAPREAMGIRTAGEKTAFEVQQLANAAGRIFQEKITVFEIEILEKALNAMLETAKRNMDSMDVVRVIDDDIGAQIFMEITKDDITASGKLRPIGARHFAAQAQLIQNLTSLSNTQLWGQISPHLSAKSLSKLVEDVLNLERYQLFSPNVAIFEQQETMRLSNQAQEDLQMEATNPVQAP
jgi:HAMP domain-containing protein